MRTKKLGHGQKDNSKPNSLIQMMIISNLVLKFTSRIHIPGRLNNYVRVSTPNQIWDFLLILNFLANIVIIGTLSHRLDLFII